MTVGINRYTNLITSEHNKRPKFMAMISACAQPAVDLQNLVLSFDSAYDLDSAVGNQLDVIGQWVGVSRNITTSIAGVYFSLDTAGLGFNQGVWLGPGQSATGLTVLPDDKYRLLLKARIAVNQWDGTVPGIYAIWAIAFLLQQFHILIQDNQDMSMTIILLTSGAIDAVSLALVLGGYIVPRPAGVRITGYTQRTAPIFGLDSNTSTVSGFDTGKWL